QKLSELKSDPECRIQRRRRVLRDVRHERSTSAAQPVRRQVQDGRPRHLDAAARDSRPAVRVTEQGDGGGRLSRTGLADQTEYLSSLHRERHAVDDLLAGRGELDPEVRYLDDAHALPDSLTRATARAVPSVTKFVPTANNAMQIAGTTMAHGWTVSPILFSLIISPQSAFGCWMPKPRKLIAATRAIDQVRRKP